MLGYACSAEEVTDGLARSMEAPTPHLGPSGGEDGDDPEYLFSWLKSLRVLIESALNARLCVVHAQPKEQL